MDDRNRPDTNVVLLRRKGDPSEAERERVASTIFAEPDDVGTFSRGNLVPPRTDDPVKPRDDEHADPYFENLQRTQRGHEQSAAATAADADTIAYFDELTTQSAAEMASPIDGPSVERPMVGSAQLPAELAQPRRVRKRPWPLRTNDGSILNRGTVHSTGSLRTTRTKRLAAPAILATLALLLAGGVAVASFLAGREERVLHASNTYTHTSLEAPLLATLQSTFAAIQRQARTSAKSGHKASDV